MTPVHFDIDSLRTLYSSSATAKAAFDYFAERQNNSAATKADRLLDVLRYRGHDVYRSDVIRLFRELEDANCGRLIAGRKGHPTRFKWSASLISVGQAASGETNTVDELTEAEAQGLPEDEDNGLVAHRFRLRADLEIELQLPADLTPAEAGRLADFVKTLPITE